MGSDRELHDRSKLQAVGQISALGMGQLYPPLNRDGGESFRCIRATAGGFYRRLERTQETE
jgi:hypothetical protein